MKNSSEKTNPAAETIDTLREKFSTEQEQEEKPKGKKRGRPKKEQFKFDEKLFRGFIQFPFTYIALRTGEEKWQLTPDETQELTHLTVTVMNKHLPKMMDKWGEELALISYLGMVVFKRRIS